MKDLKEDFEILITAWVNSDNHNVEVLVDSLIKRLRIAIKKGIIKAFRIGYFYSSPGLLKELNQKDPPDFEEWFETFK